MEKERVRLMDIQSELDRILRIRKFTDNEVALIESDLIAGLPIDVITQYAKSRHSIRWMKLISDCIRTGVDRAVIDYLCKEEQDLDNKDTVTTLLHEQVPIEVLQQNYQHSESKERMMEYLMRLKDQIMPVNDKKQKAADDQTQAQKAEPDTEQEPQKAPESGQKNEKDQHKTEDDRIDSIKQEYAEMLDQNSAIISSQQDRINESSEKIRQLQKEKEQYLAEQDQYIREKEKNILVIRKQEKLISELQEQLAHMQAANKDSSIMSEEDLPKSEDISGVDKSKSIITDSKIQTGAGDYTITDQKQGIIYPVEITRAKPERVGLIASLFLKKKSQRDIMRLSIEGELDKEQLLQIKIAMEKGLSDDQLCQLISCKVPADRMPELIEIAVLENEMGYHS